MIHFFIHHNSTNKNVCSSLCSLPFSPNPFEVEIIMKWFSWIPLSGHNDEFMLLSMLILHHHLHYLSWFDFLLILSLPRMFNAYVLQFSLTTFFHMVKMYNIQYHCHQKWLHHHTQSLEDMQILQCHSFHDKIHLPGKDIQYPKSLTLSYTFSCDHKTRVAA